MNKKQVFLVMLTLGLLHNEMKAQNELLQAYKQIELGMYEGAETQLIALEKEGIFDARSYASIGVTSMKLGKVNQAVEYFDKARKLSPTDNFFSLTFGKALISQGDYDRAKTELSFLPNDKEVVHLMDYADAAMQMRKSDKIVSEIGKPKSFGYINYAGYEIFNTYTKPKMSADAASVSANQIGYYLVQSKDGTITPLNDDISIKLNLGTISIANNGKCIYSVTSPLCQSLDCRLAKSTLYEGYFKNGKLYEGKALTFNELGMVCTDPSISYDGQTLVFASNKKGGFGGFDIYMSKLENGNWSIPKNMGSMINTAGDEITPMMVNNTLYFASNHHFGFGGFDIFSTNLDAINNGIISINEVNTPANDYFPHLSKNTIYFTSTRNGSEGIFKVDYKVGNDVVMNDQNIPMAYDLHANVDLKDKSRENQISGARLVSTGYTVTNAAKNTYYIQLAAYGASKSDFQKFAPLAKFGNVYKILAGQAVKVRMGFYYTDVEARDVLSIIKKNGYPDAFIVKDEVHTSNIELLYGGKEAKSPKSEVSTESFNKSATKPISSSTVLYKVRLASYEDPIWFDNKRVKDLGTIEQWSKGTWTIFVLGGFTTFEAAESAKIKSINRGFANAEVVVDTGGILEPLKKN